MDAEKWSGRWWRKWSQEKVFKMRELPANSYAGGNVPVEKEKLRL